MGRPRRAGAAGLAAAVLAALAAAPVLAAPEPVVPVPPLTAAAAAGAVEASTAASVQAQADFAEADRLLPPAQAVLDAARARLAGALAASERTRAELATAGAGLVDAQRAADAALAELDRLQARAEGYARSLYQAGPPSALGLFGAQDWQEVADRTEVARAVGEGAAEQLRLLAVARDAAAGQSAVRETAVRDVRTHQEQVSRLLLDASTAEREAAVAEAEVEALVDRRRAAEQAARAEQAEDQRRLAQLVAESQQTGTALASAYTGVVVTGTPGRGGLVWPSAGSITSGFGPRLNPVTGQQTLHAGTDIGAPTGTPITAAGAGTVAVAGPTEGYGNYTCLDHGGGLATCYGHQSAILVTVGQVVQRGEVIGLVGSTGYSTGPHLHFEIRVGGAPQDPLRWY